MRGNGRGNGLRELPNRGEKHFRKSVYGDRTTDLTDLTDLALISFLTSLTTDLTDLTDLTLIFYPNRKESVLNQSNQSNQWLMTPRCFVVKRV